jgi:minichromosome maintenance protein 10
MDIDLFLFGSAFADTWKLQRGMVVVLLNPAIYKRKDGKGFNLRMTENKTPLSRQQKRSEIEGGESVLEVGFSKDWAGCEALRTDGTLCGDWVDTRHTKICEYHVDQGLKRARKGRMEYAVGYISPLNTVILIQNATIFS